MAYDEEILHWMCRLMQAPLGGSWPILALDVVPIADSWKLWLWVEAKEGVEKLAVIWCRRWIVEEEKEGSVGSKQENINSGRGKQSKGEEKEGRVWSKQENINSVEEEEEEEDSLCSWSKTKEHKFYSMQKKNKKMQKARIQSKVQKKNSTQILTYFGTESAAHRLFLMVDSAQESDGKLAWSKNIKKGGENLMQSRQDGRQTNKQRIQDTHTFSQVNKVTTPKALIACLFSSCQKNFRWKSYSIYCRWKAS